MPEPENNVAERNRDIGIILLLSGVLLLPLIGAYGLWDPWEPLWAQTAREMMDNHTWVTPIYRGAPRFIHPPFTYWVMKISYMVFGVSEFSARFPIALISIVGIALNYLLVRSVFNRMAGICTSLIWLTTPLFVFLSRNSMADAIFCVSENLAFLCLLAGMVHRTKNRKYVNGFYLLLAVAVLSKGPFAVLIFLIFSLLVTALKRDLVIWKTAASLQGLALFLAILLPWYVLMFQQHGEEFTRAYFSYQTQIRFTEGFGHHDHGRFFYFRSLPFAFFPWIIFVLPALFYLLNKQDSNHMDRVHESVKMILLYLAAIWGVYAAFPAKIPHFILPALPGLAWLVGIFLSEGLKHENRKPVFWYLMVSIFFYFMTCGLWYFSSTGKLHNSFWSIKPFLVSMTLKEAIPHRLEPNFFLPACLAILGICLVLSVLRHSKFFLGLLFVVIFLSNLLFNALFVPDVSKLKSMKYLVESYMRVRTPGEPLAMVGTAKNSVFFYTNNEVVRIKGARIGTKYLEYMGAKTRVYAIVQKGYFRNLVDIMDDVYHYLPEVIDDSHLDHHLITNHAFGIEN